MKIKYSKDHKLLKIAEELSSSEKKTFMKILCEYSYSPRDPFDDCKEMEESFIKIKSQMLQVICMFLRSGKNKSQEETTGSLILDLINQVPLSLEIRSDKNFHEEKEKVYKIKFMELINFYQDQMFER